MTNKKSIIILLSLLFFIFNNLNSNLFSDNRWIRVFGGIFDEQAISVRQTVDSGYIIVGTILANNKYSAWLIKTDVVGDTLWTNKYGNNEFLSIPLVQPTADDGYIIAGSIAADSQSLVLAIKTDASGKMLWSQQYRQKKINWVNQVRQTSDGGYILAGRTADIDSWYLRSAWIVKTDESGNFLWTRSFSSINGAEAKSILPIEDGGYLIGVNWGEGISLIKVNSSGDSLWRKAYNKYDLNFIAFLERSTDGKCLIIGTTQPLMGNRRIWLIETNIDGDTLWTKSYFNNAGIYNDPRNFEQTSDGGYILLADINSRMFTQGNWIMKINVAGDTVWTKYIVSYIAQSGFVLGEIETIAPISDGGYILAGYHNEFSESRNYARLIRMDNSGKISWEQRYAANEENYIVACQGTSDNGFILAGSTYSYVTKNKDILVIKTDSLGNTKHPDNPMIDYSYILDQNYPNPFKSTTIIKYSLPIGPPIFHQVQLKVYNISGQLVKVLVEQEQEAGMYSIGWDGTDLKGNSVSVGVYFYALEANTFRSIRKMLLIQ